MTTKIKRKKYKNNIDKLLHVLDMIESTIAIISFMVMVVTVLTAIVMRFILKVPFMWGEEVSRYSMVLGIYFGMSIAVRQKAHLGVDVFLNIMPEKLELVLRFFGEVITVFVYMLLTYLAFTLVKLMKNGGQTSPAMGLPIWIIYSSLLLGFILCTLESILLIWKAHNSKKNVSNDGEESTA